MSRACQATSPLLITSLACPVWRTATVAGTGGGGAWGFPGPFPVLPTPILLGSPLTPKASQPYLHLLPVSYFLYPEVMALSLSSLFIFPLFLLQM